MTLQAAYSTIQVQPAHTYIQGTLHTYTYHHYTITGNMGSPPPMEEGRRTIQPGRGRLPSLRVIPSATGTCAGRRRERENGGGQENRCALPPLPCAANASARAPSFLHQKRATTRGSKIGFLFSSSDQNPRGCGTAAAAAAGGVLVCREKRLTESWW